jgi:hypothetical protein
MASLGYLYTKNAINELRFVYTRFGHYGLLMSGYSAEQILDRLDI